MVRHLLCLNNTDTTFSTIIRGCEGGRPAQALLPFLLGWVILSYVAVQPASAKMQTEALTVVTSTGRHEFQVEVTRTEAEKALGLMFRQHLPRRAGMLFPYDDPFEITMWMKNTYISLDMIFVRKDGVVHRIEKGTEPFSEETISSQGKVSAVLEVAAGVADEIGLRAGDRIEHPFFKR